MKIKVRRQHGMTVVELMAAVVIIGIVSALAAPGFDRAVQRIKFKAQTKNILSNLRTARSHAIADKRPFGVHFNGANYTVTVFKDIDSLSTYSYNAGVDSIIQVDTLLSDIVYLYASFPRSSVVYKPNGAASSTGDIYLLSDNNSVLNLSQLNVLAATGRSKLLYIHNY